MLLPSAGQSVASDTTGKSDSDGMDLLMDIAAARKRLRKLRLAIDEPNRGKLAAAELVIARSMKEQGMFSYLTRKPAGPRSSPYARRES